MSLFWDYFKKTLNFPLIWKPGAIAQLAKGGASALDSAKDDISWLRKQFMPSECDLDHLQNHANARGLKKFRLEDDEFWRKRVSEAFIFYKMGGTNHGMKYFFDAMGVEADIVEPLEARQKWEDAGGKKLDGTWKFDGSVKLIDFYSVTKLPHIQWAEFAVIVNLSTVTKDKQIELLKWIVSEVKPARSMMVLQFIIKFELDVKPVSVHSFKIRKCLQIPYPWDVNRLDGTWKFGTDDVLFKFDGSRKLDGSWRLGDVVEGHSYRTLHSGIVTVTNRIKKCIEISENWRYLQLGEKNLRFDGTWKLGLNRLLPLFGTLIKKHINVEATFRVDRKTKIKFDIAYPATPVKLTSRIKFDGSRKLDGTWKLGQATKNIKLDGTWKFAREVSILVEPSTKLKKRIIITTKPIKLTSRIKFDGSRKLDGSWKLGQTLRPLKLDGGWKFGDNSDISEIKNKLKKHINADVAPSGDRKTKIKFDIAYPANPVKLTSRIRFDGSRKLDGSWKLGQTVKHLRLDGTWKFRPEQSVGEQQTRKIKNKFSATLRYPKLTGYHKLGFSGEGKALKLDGTWKFGLKRERKFDGTWALGESTGPEAELIIKIKKYPILN